MVLPEVIDETLRQQEAETEPYYQAHHVNIQDVEKVAQLYIRRVVLDTLRDHGADDATLCQLTPADDTPAGHPSGHDPDILNLEMAKVLENMGMTLRSNAVFQRWLNDVPPEMPRERFMAVAAELFADGQINYGRIAALFVFAAMTCLKAFHKNLGVSRISELIAWTMFFFSWRVAAWVVGRGGWNARDGPVVPTSAISAATTVVKVVIFLGVVVFAARFIFGRR